MTSQPPLPLAPVDGVRIGQVVDLVEDATGGRVFVRGELVFAWDAGDGTGRRVAATQLARIKAATGVAIADGFGITRETLRRWMRDLEAEGTGGLVAGKRGPKGPSKLTTAMIDEVRRLRAQGKTLAAIGATVGVSTDTVRRALAPAPTDDTAEDTTDDATNDTVVDAEDATVAVADVTAPVTAGGVGPLPVLAAPVPRGAERALAGREGPAVPVFTACASAPRAGLLIALPGIAHSGLLTCAREVFPVVPAGFYGLETVLLEGVLRALAGEPRAEGATRIHPADLGRVLGMDRAPEVATIRRKIGQLAALGKGAQLQGTIAHHHFTRPSEDESLVLYVDGHVRAYQGTRAIAKTHVARLKFPAPATVETWISDARGDPVMVVMAEPAASLAAELRSLLPDLRRAVGDERRVLVGFDRGGWSPTLFRDMFAAGFDVLTWRKGPVPDLPEDAFTPVSYTDEYGRVHGWELADTTVEVPLTDGTTFVMRQVTRKEARKHHVRQLHILTTRTDLSAGEVVYRMGSRWRQENQFRYARIHLDLDSHDSYATTPDDPARLVPNPVKKTSRDQVQALYQRVEREHARTDAALLAATHGTTGELLLTNVLIALGESHCSVVG